MHPDQYTPDTICRSIGLPGFVDPLWTRPTLRLLLKPSFDPEVCITLAGTGELSVAVFAERLWRFLSPWPLPAWRGEAVIGADVVPAIVADFRAAQTAAHDTASRMICIDGMPVAAVYKSDIGTESFDEWPYCPPVRAFVGGLIRTAWEACRNPRVRNGLAACGRYLDIELPRLPEPVLPPVVRVGVFGVLDERAEVLERFAAAGGG